MPGCAPWKTSWALGSVSGHSRRIFGAHAARLRRCGLRFSLTHRRMRSLRCSPAPSIRAACSPNLSPPNPATLPREHAGAR
jgi:hypothetical protein